MIVNVIVTQHHRRPSTQISRKPVVLVCCSWFWFCWFWLALLVGLGGFGSFWVVPCFSNYGSSPALATSRICSSGLFLKSSKTFCVYFGCYNALYNYIRKAEFLSRQTILLVFFVKNMLKDRLFKTSGLQFDNLPFGPKKFLGLLRNRPLV